MNGHLLAYASHTGTKRNQRALIGAGWRSLVSAADCRLAKGFASYALDNGAWSAFKQKRPFDESAFQCALRKMGAGADWTAIPDVVAGGSASLELSLKWMRRVLDETPRALLPVQNGMSVADVRPFLGSRVGLFVGGDTEWKLATLEQWCQLGREVGCWVHIGRVNSARRIHICAKAGADSFDGTSGSRFAVTVPRLSRARDQLALKFWEASP